MVLNRLNLTYEYVYNLIEQGVIKDINTVVPVMGGLRLLHIATFNNDKKLVDYLLRKKADVHKKSPYWGTALNTAVIMDYLAITESLINYGADVNTPILVPSYWTPFRYKFYQNDVEIAELLLNRYDDVSTILNQYKLWVAKRPLQIAVERSKEAMVELLLKGNADLNRSTHISGTPLIHHAIGVGNLPIIKLLLAYGADVNDTSGSYFSQVSPLHFAVQCHNAAAVELILNDSMVDINRVALSKLSALHSAVSEEDDNIIRQLLNAGIDINLKNTAGLTAFTRNRIYTQRINETIAEHIAKLSAANFYVSEENLAVVNRENFGKLRNQCLSEIEKMKITYVGMSNVTFYNVLCNSEHKLAVSLSYVSDRTILDLDIQSLFPLYGGMLSYRLKKALGRKKLLLNAISSTNDIFHKIKLPIIMS
ncbi:putative ankyrin repeat protein RF_0381 [Microplitis mediator]|uniref:putative ankyrin repeat protein RF_0381 n=1 Tax=Microplitis mediator TaxID=375433 RepID=UPI00255530A7|nr:putative ankyrin repeat protein RF_0381 [Microplitis mediator]